MRYLTISAFGLAAAVSACATAPSRDAIVTGESPCAPVRFDIYFREGEARLTPAADQAITAAANVLKTCDVRRVQVLGLADATGGSAANLSLSQQRARSVAQALNTAGLPAPVFDVAAAGDVGAVTTEGAAEPLRRRTEVAIDAHPR